MFDCVTAGPAENWPGVAVIAAVVGVIRVEFAGAVAAIVAFAVVAFAVVALAVAPPTDAAVVPPGAMKIPASPAGPLMTTGVAGELIDAFTVTSGFAVADGGMNCPVGGVGPDCTPAGSMGPR